MALGKGKAWISQGWSRKMTMFLCQLGGINRTSHAPKKEKIGQTMAEERRVGDGDQVRELSHKQHERHTHVLAYKALPSYSSSHSLHSLALIC